MDFRKIAQYFVFFILCIWLFRHIIYFHFSDKFEFVYLYILCNFIEFIKYFLHELWEFHVFLNFCFNIFAECIGWEVFCKWDVSFSYFTHFNGYSECSIDWFFQRAGY